MTLRVRAVGLALLAAVGCSAAAAPPAAHAKTKVKINVSDRPSMGLESGATSRFVVRARRNGRPVRRATVQLLADPYPFDGAPVVVAQGTTSKKGKARLRASFDRRTRVRAVVSGKASRVVRIQRRVRSEGGQITDVSARRKRFTGTLRYPPDIQPRFRLGVYVGNKNRPRLPRVRPRIELGQPAPGVTTVSFVFKLPRSIVSVWRLQVCIRPNKASGLTVPRCGGRTAANSS
ncbi:MAG TPA: hypothetical protein VIL49_18605 [Capillimicrobium sp.]|jgi:hypothetical protein